MLLGGRGALPRQRWEKLLELCTSGLQGSRDYFKKLQLSHLSSGKERTIHTDCAGKERQSLLTELISWRLFTQQLETRLPTEHTDTRVARAAGGQSCSGRVRAGGEQVGSECNARAAPPQPAWIPPWVPEAHQDRGVLSHSHKGYCERLGCREGRRRGSCCSFHSRTVPKGTLQGHGAWGQTWHLRAILLSAWPSLPEENVVFHQDSQLTF